MNRTLQQNKQLHALISKLGIDKDTKAEMVHQYTRGRTCSSAGMTINECDILINFFSKQVEGYTPGGHTLDSNANKMRRKILSICHDMLWENPDGSVDWKALEAWLLKYGYLHKYLNDYSEAELPTLVTQFERLKTSFYAR